MSETPQDRGREWERTLARRIGGELVPQSGAGVRKLDVGRHTLVFSAKHTDDASIRIDAKMLGELTTATAGAGGVGAHVTGIIAAHIEGIGRAVAVLDLEDLLALLEEDVRVVPPTKDGARRAGAELPSFLRD